MPRTIFISSVQLEFAEERRAIRDYVRGDALFSRHFDVFLFEDQPAQSRSPTELYLGQVDQCDVYVALLGRKYGFQDDEGVSPTEREFDRAVDRRKHRLAFIKEANDAERDDKERVFIGKVERQVTRRRFVGVADLTSQLYASLIRILEEEQVLSARPFDAAATRLALASIDDGKVDEFASLAAEKRQFKRRGKNTRDTLIQLDLFEDNSLKNAAVLLFSNAPKRVAPGAEMKCMHYAGLEPVRPALSHKVFNGTVFEQADLALGFVMERMATAVGVRDSGAAVDTKFEIPQAAVAEAIVNALAHRDYTSKAGVQISVYADRVEVANPGELPRGLTPEQLRGPHSSIPRNPLIAEALFLSGYIEKSGTGTTEMIRECREAGLAEPSFAQRGGEWTVTLWRDWLNDAFLKSAALNPRQVRAIAELKLRGRIDNAVYQEVTGAPRRTSARDLGELVARGIIVLIGETGRGAFYERARARPATAGPPAPPLKPAPKPAPVKTGQKRATTKKKAPAKTGQKRATAKKKAKKPK